MSRRFPVVAALLVATACAENWPQFRGAQAAGVADGMPIPTSWDVKSGKNVLWKTLIPGLAFSSPVVWGDKVFVTTAISEDPKDFRVGLYGDVNPSTDLAPHRWKILCFDKKSGKILWEQTAHTGTPKSRRHTKNTQASPTPVTDGKHLVAWFGSEGLYVWDLSGKLLWKKDFGVLNSGWFFDPDYEWGVAASPIIHKGMAILQCDVQKDSFIASWDLRTGKEVWRTKRDEIPSWGTPNIYEGNGPDGKPRHELVTNATKAIRAYDPDTGKELWKITGKDFNSETTASAPVFFEDLILISNGYPPAYPIFAIKAGATGDISLKDGQETNDSIVWSKKRGGTRIPTPLVYRGILYTLGENGILSAWNPRTGERHYQGRVSSKAGTAHSASPVAANGNIYLPTEDGAVYVVRAGPKYDLVSTNEMGEWMMATPAISDGILLIRTATHLFAIGSTGG
ncbi:MAG: PQQ-binding-like beta-propeller repeat protein [Bryobacteraceae bacterium]